MKKILALALIVASFKAIGQYSSTYKTNIVFQNQSQGFITSLPPKPRAVSGNYYLNEQFQLADIYMKDSTRINDVNVRFDMNARSVEIQNGSEVKILPFNKLLAAVVKSPLGPQEYVNGATVNVDLKDELLQVIQDRGEVKLLAKFHTDIKKGNTSQNPMLSGISDDQIIIKKTYLVAKNKDFADAGKGKAAFKENMIRLFGSDIEPQLKKVNPKKEGDMAELISAINNTGSDSGDSSSQDSSK
jgi:hypothetical protein